MKRTWFALSLSLTAVAGAQSGWTPSYPATRRGTQTDDVGGIHVADPFRWLEDVGAAEVHAWAAAQTTVARSFIEQLPRRAEIANLAARASEYPRWSVPEFGGDRVFFSQSSVSSNQPVVYVQDRRDVPLRVLIDPNAFSDEGLIAIVDAVPSPDGRYLAYAVSTQGSTWRAVRVRDVRTNQDVGDEIHGIWGGSTDAAHFVWTADSRGFVYVRAESGRIMTNLLAPPGRSQLFYHRVGQPQASDRLVFERADHPDWRLRADISADGQYLVIAARAKTALASRMYLIDLDNPSRPNFGAPLVTLFDGGDALYDFVANEGPIFFIRTTKSAPRGRVIAMDINAPNEDRWTTVIRESFDPLVGAARVDDRLVARRLHEAHSVLELYGLDGVPRGVIALPGAGTVTELRAHARELYFEYSSFVQPPAVYRYDLDARNVAPYHEPLADSTLASFETTQLFFASGDGTRVPMFVTARRGITLDGTHPTLLAALGAFGESATPSFSPFVLAWLRLGGIYAVANVRGGGEDGRLWHEAAMGTRKHVSVDDFVAAAEFLVNQHYTRAPLLGAVGRGAGGLVAASAAVRRPALFGAVAIDDGLLDMARYDRFGTGADWTTEFGSPLDPGDLRALIAYSPVSTVRPGTAYPPMLVSAGERNDFLTPANGYKFATELQAASAPPPAAPNVALLRVDYDIGQGPGIPRARHVALDADRLTFFAGLLRAPR